MSLQVSTVLLVDDDPTTLAHFRSVLEHEPALRIATAVNGREGLNLAKTIKPDLIVSDYSMPEMDGFEFCQRVKADPELAGALFVVLSGFTDTALKVRGLNLGVDDFLTKPIEVPELIARVRATLRIKRLQDQLRDDKREVERLHGALGESFDGLLRLLIHVIDLGLPGASDRGSRLAELARKLAKRFQVPDEFIPDLELGARLHEIGRAVEHHSPGAGQPEDWRCAVVSATLLEDVQRLKGAAELIGAVYENWDGTGMPNHFVAGQIPLRARILRIAIDFLGLTEGTAARPGLNPTAAIDAMRDRQGTWYDPVALTHLGSIVLDQPEAEWAATRKQVAIEDLIVGMVLAADLSTSSGVMLLAKGATITRSLLDVISRRHLADPIIDGAWVAR